MTSNHFEQDTYSGAKKAFVGYRWTSRNATTGKEYGDIGYQTDSHDIQLFISMLEGNNASTPGYETLSPSQCTKLYNTDFVSNHRNILLITNHPSNDIFDKTVLHISLVRGDDTSPTRWMCPNSMLALNGCAGEITSMVAKGLPWRVTLNEEEVEVWGCKSEIVEERCKVQFSLGIMIVVICCNLVKACAMILTIIRSREPTLVTLGDAIDSFLRTSDPTTKGICFADRWFIEEEWTHGRRTGPSQWKQKGAQRWWTSVSKARWITCNVLFAITIIVSVVLLRLGIQHDGSVLKTDIRSM